MIFDILGSGKGKNPFPGYELHFGEDHPTIRGSINSVVTWDSDKIIPLVISGDVNGGWRENRYSHFDLYLNNAKVAGLYDCRPMTSYSVGSVSINMSVNLLLYKTIEELKSINTIKFHRTDGDADFSWRCTLWLEKSGGGGNSSYIKLFKNPFVEPLFTLLQKRENAQKWGVKHDI